MWYTVRALCFLSPFVKVHDQAVIYKNVSIEGPNGTVRSGNKASKKKGNSEGYTYKGCFRDTWKDRVFPSMSTSNNMTAEVMKHTTRS